MSAVSSVATHEIQSRPLPLFIANIGISRKNDLDDAGHIRTSKVVGQRVARSDLSTPIPPVFDRKIRELTS